MYVSFYDMDNEVNMNFIEDGLYLGNYDASRNINNLRKEGITHVLALLDTFRYYEQHDGIKYLQIEISDFPGQNIVQHLPKALRFIAEGMREGKVLVHCAAGVSRSATIVIAHSMVRHDFDFDTAKEYVRSRRSIIWPNEGFQKQLRSIDIQDYKKYLIVDA